MSETREEVQAAIDEMEKAYLEWRDEYVVIEEIEYALQLPAEEMARLEAAAAENRVFTYNTTCDQEMLNGGLHDYRDAKCCWEVITYYITEKPYEREGGVWVDMSLSDFCLECNPECDEDKDDTECDTCGGSGYMRYQVRWL